MKIRKLLVVVALGACFLGAARGAAGERSLFGATHLLPSPMTLPAGTLVFGTDVAFGLTDFLQVGTQLMSDFYKVYNANAKIALIDYPEFSFAVTGGWTQYNYRDIDSRNPDVTVTSWLPGAVAAFQLVGPVAWFVGGNLNYTSATILSEGVESSGYLRGAAAETDLAFAYNALGGKKSKGRGADNALCLGVSYDFSYKMPGVGVSHHWPGFHLGVHYYMGADRYPLRPIISGGGVMRF